MILRDVQGARRAAALAWLVARFPEIGSPSPAASISTWSSGDPDVIDAIAVLDRQTGRIEWLAHADDRAQALTDLLAELRRDGVCEALLRDHVVSSAQHALLANAGFEVVRETEVVHRNLAEPPRPTHAWQHRGESQLGVLGLRELVARALVGGTPRHLDAGDPVGALERTVPETFRRDWWSVAELDGEPIGVVLPRAEPRDGVSIAFLGILPRWRGRRLAADLLADALARLAAAGARYYIDEADLDNVAAHRMLAAVGCRRVVVRRLYRASG